MASSILNAGLDYASLYHTYAGFRHRCDCRRRVWSSILTADATRVFVDTSVVIGRRPEAKRDWAPLIAATVAGVIAMAAQTLVVLLRPVTQDWRVFLAAYVPFLALAIVVQGRVRK